MSGDAHRVRRSRGDRVPAADAFFLHVESAAAPQHVGALILLETVGRPGGPLTRADLHAVLEANLDKLPRFAKRLSAASRWRRPRWLDNRALDWHWHVAEHDLTGSDADAAALEALVARLATTPLPRDRPLWRLVLVTGLDSGRAAVVLTVHHVIADGLGLIAQVLELLEPPLPRSAWSGSGASPTLVRRAVGTVVGLVELATDGRPSARLPCSGTAQRRFGTTSLPLAQLREIARRHRARLSDVLLSAVAGGLARVLPPHWDRLRVAVPLTAGDPGESDAGNLTAAVMIDLPLGRMSEYERLEGVASRSRRLHSGTRVLAARFVMHTVGELMPMPLHAWFARTVYGGRYFQAIVSNMPGPNARLTFAGAAIDAAFPLVPLAPGAPLAVGAIGLNGSLGVGVNVDPALLADAGQLVLAIHAVVDELAR